MKNFLSLLLLVCCLWSCAEQKDEPPVDTYRIRKQAEYQVLVKKYLEVEEKLNNSVNRDTETKMLRLLVLNDTSVFDDVERTIYWEYRAMKRDSMLYDFMGEEQIEYYLEGEPEGDVIRLKIRGMFDYTRFIRIIKIKEDIELTDKGAFFAGCYSFGHKKFDAKCVDDRGVRINKISESDFSEIFNSCRNLEYLKSDSDLKKSGATDCMDYKVEFYQKRGDWEDKYTVDKHCPNGLPINDFIDAITEIANAFHKTK